MCTCMSICVYSMCTVNYVNCIFCCVSTVLFICLASLSLCYMYTITHSFSCHWHISCLFCLYQLFLPSFFHSSFIPFSLPSSLLFSLSFPPSLSQEVLRLIKEDKEAEASQLLRSDKELLHEACESGSVEAVNLLLDRGVTVSEWNKVSSCTCTQ